MDAKKIGERIAKLRKERNMTQIQLAERLYVTEKAVSKWECGNDVPEQILQFQKSDYPLVNSYEDIVIHSCHLSSAMINELAIEFIDTIMQFEEIIYLLNDFTQETLQKLCLYHKGKITADIDLSLLPGRIDSDCFSALCECRQGKKENT